METVSGTLKTATWLLILLVPALRGQPAGDHAAFEVASIKPAAPPDFKADSIRFIGCIGGPGWRDPGTITCHRVTISTLVTIAYGISFFRISGQSVKGANLPQFDIVAKVPADATEEQVEQMWKSLLAERFKLEAHYETKEMPVYALVIAKGGLKIKEAVNDPGEVIADTPVHEMAIAKPDKDGFPLVGPGKSDIRFSGDIGHYAARGSNMGEVADRLEGELYFGSSAERPVVVDATGLKGKYDFRLWWSRMADQNGPADGPPLRIALETQLGLRIEQRKAPVKILVVDHSERFPTEN